MAPRRRTTPATGTKGTEQAAAEEESNRYFSLRGEVWRREPWSPPVQPLPPVEARDCLQAATPAPLLVAPPARRAARATQ